MDLKKTINELDESQARVENTHLMLLILRIHHLTLLRKELPILKKSLIILEN